MTMVTPSPLGETTTMTVGSEQPSTQSSEEVLSPSASAILSKGGKSGVDMPAVPTPSAISKEKGKGKG